MQNVKNNIVIFSRPIRSGKTTELFRFIKNSKNTGGFLTPDRDRKRMFYDIASQNFHEFELAEGSTEPAVAIGKFRFSVNAFNKAKLLFNAQPEHDLFVIDEVGKLEIQYNDGFEPELGSFINRYKTAEQMGILLLVVRDTLLEAVVNHYGLEDAKFIHRLSDFSKQKLPKC